ncbi:Imm10 family immunity protein [Methylomonas sp. YC3]
MTMVVFSNDELDPSRFVLIQQSNKYNEQDKKMGMDKMHIQVDDQSRSHYGGITKISIEGNILFFELEKNRSNKATNRRRY